MHISKLSVIRMGAVTDKSIELSPTLNIIYGENEAGKTTLRQSLRLALYPISPQTTLDFGKTGPREVTISIQDGSNITSVTRVSKTEKSSEPPQGTPQALDALSHLVDNLSWNDFRTVYNIGTEEIEQIKSDDVSALMAAEWGSRTNPTQVLKNLDSAISEFQKNTKKAGSQSILYGIREIKNQLEKVHEVQRRFAEAQDDIDAIQEKQELAHKAGFLRDELRATINGMTDDVASLQTAEIRLPQIQDRLLELAAVLSDADQRLQSAESQLNYPLLENELLILDRMSQTKEEIQRLSSNISHLKGQLSASEAEYNSHSALPDFSTVADLQSVIVKLTRLEAERDSAGKELSSAKLHAQHAEDELQRLEDMLSDSSLPQSRTMKPTYVRLSALGIGVFFIMLILTQVLNTSLPTSLVIGLASALITVAGFFLLLRNTLGPQESALERDLHARITLQKADIVSSQGLSAKWETIHNEITQSMMRYLDEVGLSSFHDTDILELIAILRNAESRVGLGQKIQSHKLELVGVHQELDSAASSFVSFITPYLHGIPEGLSVQKLLQMAQDEITKQRGLIADTERAKKDRALKAQEIESLTLEHTSLNASINETLTRYEALGISGRPLDETINLIKNEIAEKGLQLASKEEEIAELHTDIGRLQEAVNRTLGDTTLESAHSELSKLRAKLRKDLTDYTTYSLAREMLSQALTQYASTKERDLLQIGSEILNNITDGELVKIEIDPANKGLICQRKDGQVIAPSSMSTGTREQLFMALRFGVLLSRDEVGRSVPIIMDDTFAHSDHRRRAVAFQSIARLALSTGKQILYFTCHRHMADELAAIAKENSVDDYRRIEIAKG